MSGNIDQTAAGIRLGWRFRRELAKLLRSSRDCAGILGIEPEEVKLRGIEVLALDFDGVLSHHGASEPLPEVVGWFEKCVRIFGENRVFILSNRPTDSRRLWFAGHFPGVRFVSGVRKKPFPDGISKVAELSGAPVSEILMVDDRLLTGCLAAVSAGARAHYISRPYISFRNNTRTELFFWLLRRVERLLVRMAK